MISNNPFAPQIQGIMSLSFLTRVSAFREILQSLQCKIVQYTFLGQYLIKLQDFFPNARFFIQLGYNLITISWDYQE